MSSNGTAPTAQAYIVREDIEARLDSREVFDAHGELVGCVLYDTGSGHVGLTVRDFSELRLA